MKDILVTNEGISVRLDKDDFGSTLSTCINGWQWSGMGIKPNLAKLMIEALTQYIQESES